RPGRSIRVRGTEADDDNRHGHDRPHLLEPELRLTECADRRIHASPCLQALGSKRRDANLNSGIGQYLLRLSGEVQAREYPGNRLLMIERDLDPHAFLLEIHLPSGKFMPAAITSDIERRLLAPAIRPEPPVD